MLSSTLQAGSLANARSSLPAVRVFTFTFEKQDDGKQATISQAMYEGGLDKKLFDQQKFDEETLAAGKTLVQKDVVDILL